MMKKINILFLFLFFCFLVLGKAAASTPPASESAVQGIRDKVKEIVREKIEVNQQGQKAAYFGEINKINDELVTIQTNQGDQQFKVASNAALLSKAGKKITLQDLEKGDFAIAIGYLEENNLLNAKRLVLAEKSKPALREVAFGKVTDISTEERVITVKNSEKNLVYTLEINNKTTISKKIDGKIQEIKLDDVSKEDNLVVVGTPSENEHKIITAKIIRITTKSLAKETPTSSPSP